MQRKPLEPRKRLSEILTVGRSVDCHPPWNDHDRILHWLDGQLEWVFQGFAVTGARALLDAVITSTLSFVVFTFGSLLVAIQVASGQMTPRIIATVLLRNNVVRYTVGLFIFTFMVALGTHDRIDDLVHRLSALCGIVS